MSKIILYKKEGEELEVIKDSDQHKEMVKKGWSSPYDKKKSGRPKKNDS